MTKKLDAAPILSKEDGELLWQSAQEMTPHAWLGYARTVLDSAAVSAPDVAEASTAQPVAWVSEHDLQTAQRFGIANATLYRKKEQEANTPLIRVIEAAASSRVIADTAPKSLFIFETYTGQNGWLEVSADEFERTKHKYEHRIRRRPEEVIADTAGANEAFKTLWANASASDAEEFAALFGYLRDHFPQLRQHGKGTAAWALAALASPAIDAAGASDLALSELFTRAAEETNDWCERQENEPTKMQSDAVFVRTIVKMVASYAAGASSGDVRDAARYQWLRSAKYDEAIRALFDFKGDLPLIPWRNASNQLDAAIDAAIAKESGK